MSYDDTLPTDMDKARALVGDTSNDASTELLTDDHIEAVLAMQSDFSSSIAFLADELAIRFAQKPGSVALPGGLQVSWADRVRTWLALAANARRGMYAGGESSLTFIPITYGVVDDGEYSSPPDYWP